MTTISESELPENTRLFTLYALLEELMEHWLSWDRQEQYYLRQLLPQLKAEPSKRELETERHCLGEIKEQGEMSDTVKRN
jgi:hypothetical protein